MNTKIKKSISISIIAAFVMQLSACGTIIHPERKGQISGQLDTSIVALNAVGLLFFFVPGIIAFAVDFNNGTIYLPNGSASSHSGNVTAVTVEGEITDEIIEQVILEKTGETVNLSEENILSSEKTVTLTALNNEVRFLSSGS